MGSMSGLHDLLTKTAPLTEIGRDGFFDVPSAFLTPGYWSAYVARAKARGLRTDDLKLPAGQVVGYALAMGIQRALGEADTYAQDRKGAGARYSPLVLLESIEQTEHATAEINNCIRSLFTEDGYVSFVSKTCELMGDLLDNVWSHGKSTGFSMAQRWNERNPKEFSFEVSVADQGLGFMRELQRAGIAGVGSHADAIAWCIQKGHSTKKREVDDWAQRLPSDMMGNPMQGIGRVVESDNHHMGLGLAKLIETVSRFKGRLWLASGDAMLIIRASGELVYETIPVAWQGVAIACRPGAPGDTGRRQ